MAKGYIRIVEAMMLIIILISLVMFINQNQIIVPPNPSNPPTLLRYAIDLTNMVCNSDMNRQRILSGDLASVYSDLVYTIPPEYKVRVSTGTSSYGPEPSSNTVYSHGCVISNERNKIANVTIQVWI